MKSSSFFALRTLLIAFVFSLCSLSIFAADAPRGTEQYAGFDIALLAEATAQLTTMRTQHGEKQAAVEFEKWLQGKNLDSDDYHSAYKSWFERFRADPTGQLETRFHRVNSEWVQQLNYADVKDQRQEQREGVTLDTYAKVAVALSRQSTGVPLVKTLSQFGIKSEQQWQKVNEAWGLAMKEDPTFALVQQYGALYQKYAGPQFAAEQDAALANTLAAHNKAPTAAPEVRKAAPTLDEIVDKMAASTGREKSSLARQYALACDLWSSAAKREPKDPRATHCAKPVLVKVLLPVIVDGVEHAEDDTIGFNVGLLDYLKGLGLVDADVRSTANRALNRAKDQLEILEASFAPIKDKAVPERLPLRTKIDEYTSAINQLQRLLKKW